LAQFLTDKGIATQGGKTSAKDFISGGANAVKSLASFINSCKTGCDAKTGLDAAGGMILAIKTLIGTAFP